MLHKHLLQKLLLVAIIATIVSGCFKDTGTRTYKLYTPVYQTMQTVRAAIKNDAPQPITSVGKMVIYGKYIFLNELNRGIHIIDNTNPVSPVNKGFINILGNENLAIKDNMLFADCYTDLMAIDISNPNNISVKTYINNLFPGRAIINGFKPDSGKVIIDWIVKDTIVNIDIKEGQGIWTNNKYLTSSQSFANAASISGGIGTTGSTSRYAIVDNYLYALSSSSINTVDISKADAPKLTGITPIIFNNETIFPFQNKLFIGSQTGMFIYSIANPIKPELLSQFGHARVCDPVIADGDYAFVTLHSNPTTSQPSSFSNCGGALNELDIVDITNLKQTKLLKTYTLTRPYGLSKDGDLLFICDGEMGLKIFDATNPINLIQKQNFSIGIAYDVIALNGIAYVTTKDGLYQYSYANTNNVTLLSKIALN